jgi:hypothetical protein
MVYKVTETFENTCEKFLLFFQKNNKVYNYDFVLFNDTV